MNEETKVTGSADTYIEIDDPNPKVGMGKALLWGAIPGLDDSPYIKSFIGGCPACGEGRELSIEYDSGLLGINPTNREYDFECNRCGTILENEGRWMKVSKSDAPIEGLTLSEDECKVLSKYKRENKSEKYEEKITNLSDKETADHKINKLTGIGQKIYYYPIALVIFLASISSQAGGNFVEDFIVGTTLALIALPEIRERIASRSGYSLPWFGRIIFAVVYGILGLAFLYALLVPA